MDIVVLIGRVLFVALVLGAAFGHLTQTRAMAGYAASKKIPFATATVFGSGVLLAAGGLMVLLGANRPTSARCCSWCSWCPPPS